MMIVFGILFVACLLYVAVTANRLVIGLIIQNKKENYGGAVATIALSSILGFEIYVVYSITRIFFDGEKTLLFELLDMIMRDVLIISMLTMLIASLSIRTIADKVENIKIKKLKIYVIYICILLLLVTAYDSIHIQEATNMNRLSYKFSIVKDLIANETRVSMVEASNIKVSYVQKTTTSVGGRRRTRSYGVSYIAYVTNSYMPSSDRKKTVYMNNTNSYKSIATNKLVSIIRTLSFYEDEVEIEYYNNSKIIKSIDGIDKNDYTALENRIEELRKNKSKK